MELRSWFAAFASLRVFPMLNMDWSWFNVNTSVFVEAVKMFNYDFDSHTAKNISFSPMKLFKTINLKFYDIFKKISFNALT